MAAPKQGGRQQKGKKSEPSGPPRAEITCVLTDAQASKFMKAKAITAPELARQAGVKTSAAAAYLRRAEAAGSVSAAGGRSGHRVYRPAG